MFEDNNVTVESIDPASNANTLSFGLSTQIIEATAVWVLDSKAVGTSLNSMYEVPSESVVAAATAGNAGAADALRPMNIVPNGSVVLLATAGNAGALW